MHQLISIWGHKMEIYATQHIAKQLRKYQENISM